LGKISTARESLFNEVKGSLFEFLVGKNLAVQHGEEKDYIESIDRNYLNVLSQQDRMVRQFYPELGTFLSTCACETVEALKRDLGEYPRRPRLMGKLVNSLQKQDWHEADLIVETNQGTRPISLKLNKEGAFVNTKSGGVRSFLTQYFSFLPTEHQTKFNQLVDLEFERVSRELHDLAGIEYVPGFKNWLKAGLSELPGELDGDQRQLLKSYYARLAKELHSHLSSALTLDPDRFTESLFPLMGFSSRDILQVVCFHHFNEDDTGTEIFLHDARDIVPGPRGPALLPFHQTASVEILIGTWSLQVRIKPMNKFTTTAIKINCSVKVKQSSEA
jgi:hypothetical protein